MHHGGSGLDINGNSSQILVQSCAVQDVGGDGISVHQESEDVTINNTWVDETGYVLNELHPY